MKNTLIILLLIGAMLQGLGICVFQIQKWHFIKTAFERHKKKVVLLITENDFASQKAQWFGDDEIKLDGILYDCIDIKKAENKYTILAVADKEDTIATENFEKKSKEKKHPSPPQHWILFCQHIHTWQAKYNGILHLIFPKNRAVALHYQLADVALPPPKMHYFFI